MANTFIHKLLLTIIAGFVAAVLVYLLRHVVNQALYDSNEGWKDMFIEKGKKK